MSFRTVICLAVVSVLLLATANSAFADQTTATSTVVRVQVVDSSSENYRLFRGAVWLEYDKDKANYRWGGAHCARKGLSDMNVGLLFAAFRARYAVTINYHESEYKRHTFRCITGFSVDRR